MKRTLEAEGSMINGPYIELLHEISRESCLRALTAFRNECGRDGQPYGTGWCFVCRAKALMGNRDVQTVKIQPGDSSDPCFVCKTAATHIRLYGSERFYVCAAHLNEP